MNHRHVTLGSFLALILLAVSYVDAAPYRVIPEQSVFAVVTHKGGFASGLAHDHFVAPSDFEVSFQFDETDPLSAQFEMRFRAEDLVVDSPELRQKWYERLEALGVLDDPFKEVSDDDRQKIRRSMLDEKQLDATSFPEIAARVVGVAPETVRMGNVEFPYRVTLRLRVHGQTVEAPVAARFDSGDGVIRIEAVGLFHFRDFGIKPYSAMLGAVKNKDEFHVYVGLVAVPVTE